MQLFRHILAFCLLFSYAYCDILHEEKEIPNVLATEIPDLKIDSLEIISTGWDNLVADVNHEWIFRFPRTEKLLQTLSREQKLLDRLHANVDMPIPYYQYSGVHTTFVGYKKIQGIPLDDELYLSLDESQKEEVAASMAQFLTQLHGSVTHEEARAWGYEDYAISENWIRTSLLGTLPEHIDEMVQEALEYPRTPTRLVLIHNDLHGDNLAFDPIQNKISGIFDFSDAVIADYTIEFGKLFNIHADLAKRTARIYSETNQLPNPLLPAAVDFILRRSAYILYAREEGNHRREKSLMRMLTEFLPIWNECRKFSPKEGASER